jgi:hypothetical protein
MTRSARGSADDSVSKLNAPIVRELSVACEATLRPIAAQFLELGFGASQFVQVAKLSYVQAAAKAIKKTGQRATVSRIAALTGLQRKEIRTLIEDPRDEAAAMTRYPPTMRVLTGWQADGAFRSKSGRVRALKLEGPNSFRALVEKYAGDVTHVALLRELERLGWVSRTTNGLVVIQLDLADVQRRAAAVQSFAARIADYAAALHSGGEVAEVGSYAGYRESPPTEKRLGAALSRTFIRRAEEFLAGFERWVSRSHKQTTMPTPDAHSQFGVGIYLVERQRTPGENGEKPPAKKPRPRSRAKPA